MTTLSQAIFNRLRLCLSLGILIMTFSSTTVARDISNEQRAASEARDTYNNAITNERGLSQQIAEQKKRVATEQARLNDLQDKQAANKSAIESAKVDLEVKVQALEKAWPERNK